MKYAALAFERRQGLEALLNETIGTDEHKFVGATLRHKHKRGVHVRHERPPGLAHTRGTASTKSWQAPQDQ